MNTLSVIIPMLDSACSLQSSLDSVPREDRHIEVIVVEDQARASLRDRVADRPGTLWMKSVSGRAEQMNAGVEAASGRVLVFLYAGTRLEEGWPEAVRHASRQPDFVLGAFRLRLDGHRLVFRLQERWANGRARMGNKPRGRQVLFMKRRTFLECGGFPAPSPQEDIDLVCIMLKGRKLALLHHQALVPTQR